MKHKFDPTPSSDTIRENNRPVRELVKRLHAADDDTGAQSSTKANSSMVAKVGHFEIVNGNKCAVPAGAEFHLGDAANCLSRMVNSGREVPDERDSFLL